MKDWQKEGRQAEQDYKIAKLQNYKIQLYCPPAAGSAPA
jgi:hypothetical protein